MAQIYLPGVGGVGGLTMIIMQVSVQIGLNWYWTGTELGKNKGPKKLIPLVREGLKNWSNIRIKD